MSAQTGPNVGTSLVLFHHVITHGIEVSQTQIKKLSETGFPDERYREGFTKYVRSLATVIDAHHLVEDDLAFPYFKDKVPEAPYARLNAEHQQMLPILAQMRAAVQKLEVPVNEKEGFNELEDALNDFARIWVPHIQAEEQNFSIEKLSEILPPDEHLRLINEFGQHSQPHSQPAELVTPFILFNLSSQERAGFSANLPPEVTNHLVPNVWKPAWEPMSPFLRLE